MTTTATLVARSLRLIQVIDAVQPVKPQDMSTAIQALNALMARWEANGLAMGWQPVDSPSDELPLPVEAERTVAYCLGAEMAPEFGVQVMEAVARGATDGYAKLLRDQMVATPIQPILDVPDPDWWGATRFRSTVWDY